MGDLLAGEAVEVALSGARPRLAAEPGPGNIGAVALGADQVGVEGDQIARRDLPAGAFLEPGIRARSGASRRVSIHSPPRLMFSACSFAQSSCSVMPGRRCCCITRIAGLAGRDRAAHGLDLVGRLEGAGELHDRLAVLQLEAQGPEGGDPRGVGLVDREPAVAAAMRPHQIGELGAQSRACSITRGPLSK